MLIVAWHFFGEVLGIEELASPATVAVFTFDLLISLEWVSHATASLGRLLIAFTISMVFGTVLALFLGVTSFWEAVFKDFVIMWITIPGVIIVIFAAMWFGTGNLTPIAAGSILSIGPTAQIVYESVKDIDNDLIEMARSFDVSRRRILSRVVVRSVLPAILVSARLSFVGIWNTIALGEYLATTSGLGYQIRIQLQRTSFTGLISWALIFVVIVAVIEYGILAQLENRLFAYRQNESKGD